MSCAAVTTPGSLWDKLCPSLPASILFAALFGLTTIVHVGQAILYRKPYSLVIILSALTQTITYVFRTISIQNPASQWAYIAWFVLILIAPLWTNAYVYMVFGRMVWNFTSDHSIWRLRPWHFATVFVVLDIVALIVQVYGAGSASGSDKPTADILEGLHIYMGGVGLQQLFIFVVCGMAWSLHRKIPKGENQAQVLLYTLFIVLALITLRIIFRIVEYSQGLTSTIPNQEAYQYCLDSLPMLIAIVLFHFVHPGRVMPGKESDMPGFSERRRLRKAYGDVRKADYVNANSGSFKA